MSSPPQARRSPLVTERVLDFSEELGGAAGLNTLAGMPTPRFGPQAVTTAGERRDPPAPQRARLQRRGQVLNAFRRQGRLKQSI